MLLVCPVDAELKGVFCAVPDKTVAQAEPVRVLGAAGKSKYSDPHP
jgi:hypothetical protein